MFNVSTKQNIKKSIMLKKSMMAMAMYMGKKKHTLSRSSITGVKMET